MLSNLKNKIHNKSTFIFTFILIVFARIIFMSSLVPYNLYNDSREYINFPLKEFLSLNFISGRSPIYPVVIRVCKLIGGDLYYLNLVVYLQVFVSLMSVVILYKTCRLIIKNEYICCFIAFLYGVSPAIAGWDNSILTESFSLSGTVLFLYLIVNFIQTPRFKWGVSTIILTFVLSFLRPTFLLFSAFIFAFWILRLFFEKDNKKMLLKLVTCSVISFALVFCYASIFKKSHGIISISDALPRQYLYVCIERGYYKNSDDIEFIEIINGAIAEYNGEIWGVTGSVLNQIGNYNAQKLSQQCFIKNWKDYLTDSFKLTADLSGTNFPGYHKNMETHNNLDSVYLNTIRIFQNLFNIFKVVHLYLLIIIEILFVLLALFRKKDDLWIHLGLCFFMAGIFFSTILSTCAEYQRTMIAVLPFMYLSMGIIIMKICKFITYGNEKNLIK